MEEKDSSKNINFKNNLNSSNVSSLQLNIPPTLSVVESLNLIDIKNKKDINIWICTELNKINNASKNFTYTSQVSSFCHGDMINLQFNIFSEGNIINTISIEWTEPAISLVPGGVFEKSKYISPYSFDQIRACEVETQILFWKNILPENDGGIVNEVKKIMEISKKKLLMIM